MPKNLLKALKNAASKAGYANPNISITAPTGDLHWLLGKEYMSSADPDIPKGMWLNVEKSTIWRHYK